MAFVPLAGFVMAFARALAPLVTVMAIVMTVDAGFARDLGRVGVALIVAGLDCGGEAQQSNKCSENYGFTHLQVLLGFELAEGPARTWGPCIFAPDGRLLIHVSNMSGRLRHDENLKKWRAEMILRLKSTIGAIVIAAAVLLPAASLRADDADHDAVWQAVARGEIRPLSEIRDIVRGKLAGEIAGVEIERKNGRWLYEFRVVDGQGRLFEVYVDARTGEIDRIKEK